ncbi:hypothetical protein DFH08DRAFT_125312 [Mycena albidolilacea]|uniref:Uncharacterized protein n=1 Tax=Mycena albidolilacea TaxID=1033008 RepID=A0AAD7A651_9AGAR|nr:hypothetical protein DFH08DRAFT_125312 [Mycena albidolilacea]
MPSPLQTVLDVILGITPVPGLSAAFNILSHIVSAIEQARKSKQRLAVLAQSAAQLLQTLNTEFRAARLVQSACGKPLKDLHSLLLDVQKFVNEEQARPFFKVLLNHDDRMEGIDGFYRRMSTLADAFQISALLNIQGMLSNDGWAARQDGDSIHKRLMGLEHQMQLWHTLSANQQPQYFVQPQAGPMNWPLAYGPVVLNPAQTSSVVQHYYVR